MHHLKTNIKMKNFAFLLALSLGIMSTSCSKDDDDSIATSKYKGEWSGQYSGDVTGNWSATVNNTGQVVGTFTPDSTTFEVEINGSVNSKGNLIAKFDLFEGNFNGQLNDSIASGTWENTTQNLSGVWTGQKQ